MLVVEANEVARNALTSPRQISAKEIEQASIPVEEVVELIPPTKEDTRKIEVVVKDASTTEVLPVAEERAKVVPDQNVAQENVVAQDSTLQSTEQKNVPLPALTSTTKTMVIQPNGVPTSSTKGRIDQHIMPDESSCSELENQFRDLNNNVIIS